MMTESRGIQMEQREGLVLLHHLLSTAVTLLSHLVYPDGAPPEAPVVPRAARKVSAKLNGYDIGKGPLIPAPIKPEAFYTLQQVADFLGKSVPTVRKKVTAGNMDAEKRGPGKGQYFVKGSEVIKHSSKQSDL